MKLRPEESWELKKDFGPYSIWLTSEEDSVEKDDQFFLSWAMVCNETGRVEGYTSTYTAAYETVELLGQATAVMANMEAAKAMMPEKEEQEVLPFKEPEVH